MASSIYGTNLVDIALKSCNNSGCGTEYNNNWHSLKLDLSHSLKFAGDGSWSWIALISKNSSSSVHTTRLVKYFLCSLRLMSLISFCFFPRVFSWIQDVLGQFDLGSFQLRIRWRSFCSSYFTPFHLELPLFSKSFSIKWIGSCHLCSACSGGIWLPAYISQKWWGVSTADHVCIESAFGSASVYARSYVEVLSAGCLRSFGVGYWEVVGIIRKIMSLICHNAYGLAWIAKHIVFVSCVNGFSLLRAVETISVFHYMFAFPQHGNTNSCP